tara:strand:+ start:4565 stop:4729 length:165 start_codon:yes stop_codon:yes gene_type:complete
MFEALTTAMTSIPGHKGTAVSTFNHFLTIRLLKVSFHVAHDFFSAAALQFTAPT